MESNRSKPWRRLSDTNCESSQATWWHFHRGASTITIWWDAAGGASRLTVEGPAGEQLVPLVDAICRQIDPDARRIVIAPPEGLLDLNRVRGHGRARRGGRT
jgi:hypothetical protein